MELKITRLSYDSDLYAVDLGASTRPGVKASELKRWLLNLGATDVTVDTVLNMAPNKSVTVDLPGKAA